MRRLLALCGLFLSGLPAMACPGYGAVAYVQPAYVVAPQLVYAPAVAYAAPAVSYAAAPACAATASAEVGYATPAALQSVPYAYSYAASPLGFFSYGGSSFYHDGFGIRSLSYGQAALFSGRSRSVGVFPGGAVAITRERGFGLRRDSINVVSAGGASVTQINERRGLLGLRSRETTIVAGPGGASVTRVEGRRGLLGRRR